ncbi:N-acetyltransferase family protein [Salipaludibacillus sp. HK11]|uniref:GNAT family N-acetyltransferase n=1 Tax=Salipaludibacillus sp. HK11 TaxID=3394320 RepID=UPI0039FB9492
MNIHIQIATIEDYFAVNSIVKEGQEEHSEELPYIFNKVDQVMSENYFCELLESLVSDILIAKINEEVVGFAVMELSESPPFDSMTPRKFAYMNDFGIKSSYQRKGIGKLLFEDCLKWSKSKDASSLDLNVWEFNRKAISFYKSFGMETISRKMTLRF